MAVIVEKLAENEIMAINKYQWSSNGENIMASSSGINES